MAADAPVATNLLRGHFIAQNWPHQPRNSPQSTHSKQGTVSTNITNVVYIHCRMEGQMPYRSVDWTALSLALITAAQSVLVTWLTVRGAAHHIRRARRRKPRSGKDAVQ